MLNRLSGCCGLWLLKLSVRRQHSEEHHGRADRNEEADDEKELSPRNKVNDVDVEERGADLGGAHEHVEDA